MSNEQNLLRGNFQPARSVTSSPESSDARAEFRKRALENISGSMVFVEDQLLYWDIANE